jgi:hypothetical protein
MKHFDIKIDDNDFEEDILKILSEIRNEWDKKEINFKVSLCDIYKKC